MSYRRQIAPLTARDCHVILFDLPWHGLSGPGMEQPTPRPTAEILGQSVEAVRAHFGLQEEPLTLLGWSYDGVVLRSYLLQLRPRNIAGIVFVAALLDFESFMPIALRESPQIVEVFQRLATPSAPMAERLVGLQMFVDSHKIRYHCMRSDCEGATTTADRLTDWMAWTAMRLFPEPVGKTTQPRLSACSQASSACS
jgi:pimeloyl-ACP methyl ester carboxylesterase